MKTFLSLVGLVLVFEGLPYLAFPEAMQRWLLRVAATGTAALRTTGAAAVLAGLAICFLARRSGIFG